MKLFENFRTPFRTPLENCTPFYDFTTLLKTRKPLISQGFQEYPEPESNRYNRNGHRILSPARLPIPPSGQKEIPFY